MPVEDFTPRILSEEEIDMYLASDRRAMDRLILYSLNRLAACIIPHALKEEKRDEEYARLLKELGGLESMLNRAAYVDALISRSAAKTRMMEKVSQSSVTWALVAFLAFLAHASWEAIVNAVKTKLGG